ncbi:MAG: GntR family transcriptional regulator [Eubacterium ramulus]
MIQLNYRDTRPFYQQIKDNVRQLVVSGALKKKDEKLPSVRDMAASLAINPNTIQRAYRELESEGYIYTLSGKGTFVAEVDHSNQFRQQELLPQFDKIVSELLYLSMPVNDLTNRILSLSGRRIQA